MKRWMWIFTVVRMMFLTSRNAFAYTEKISPQEEQTIADVETLALGAPLYTEKEGTPTREEYVQIMNEAGPKILKCKFISYEAVAQGILQTTGKDIHTMERIPAAKIFRDHVKEYADAYVVSTVTKSRRTVFFFDVYRAGTKDLIYSYEIILDPDELDDTKTYQEMVGKFYKNFNWSASDQRKAQKKEQADREKAERKAQRAREKAA